MAPKKDKAPKHEVLPLVSGSWRPLRSEPNAVRAAGSGRQAVRGALSFDLQEIPADIDEDLQYSATGFAERLDETWAERAQGARPARRG